MKNFIHINTGFVCLNCNHKNPPLSSGCRNHCRRCLYSLHVDYETPGDRLSRCRSLMEPIKLDYSGKKGYIIIHRCLRCDTIKRNKAAEDDDYNMIIQLS